MREVLGGASPFCEVPEDVITGHFKESYTPRDGCVNEPPSPHCVIPAVPPPALLEAVRPEDVARLLRRTTNTAPGPDGIRYSDWRRNDPTGHVLAKMFNICLAEGKFPPAWKMSKTVLIHKKGPVKDITNWRPIALSDTAGKLLCSLLADRLSTWASRNNLLSWAQKGFTPAEGCLEHNFILQELLDNARHRGSEACIAWLDLANAFGSVPHPALFSALRSAGLPEDQLRIIQDLYSGSATSIRHCSGTTRPIVFGAGVRQGCPLSPILFNLVMESLIRPIVASEVEHGATLHGTSLGILAYADDLAITAKSPESLQTLLDTVSSAATWVGLKFKPPKCATLHVRGRRAIDTPFRIYNAPLHALGEAEAYQHLGVPTGFRVDQTPKDTITRLEAEADKIFTSNLAPWQKLHAARTFLVPQLDFNLMTARIKKSNLRDLDAVIKRGCKSVLGLPTRASPEMVAIPPSWGGAGLLPLGDLADLAAVQHAFRLLTSPDPKVARIALQSLTSSAGHRSSARTSKENLVAYLNGETTGNSNFTSTFSSARTAINRIKKDIPNVKWGWCGAKKTFQITTPGKTSSIIIDRSSRKHLSSTLRTTRQLSYRAALAEKPDQGRVARVTTTCPTANHMLATGRHCRFADWRFIHRARVNVLPLNGCRRWGANDRRCRRCGHHDETTAHVLCHCTSSLATGITKRHNAILDILSTAVDPEEGTEVRINKRVPLKELLPNEAIPEEIARCRPDMVTIDKTKKIIKIVDVTMPYEDGWQSIEVARERKHTTYAPLAKVLSDGGYTASVDAVVVGPLGTWDGANWGTLARLGIKRRQGTSLARRCVSEAIKWSRDIYVTHVTGVQQWQ